MKKTFLLPIITTGFFVVALFLMVGSNNVFALWSNESLTFGSIFFNESGLNLNQWIDSGEVIAIPFGGRNTLFHKSFGFADTYPINLTNPPGGSYGYTTFEFRFNNSGNDMYMYAMNGSTFRYQLRTYCNGYTNVTVRIYDEGGAGYLFAAYDLGIPCDLTNWYNITFFRNISTNYWCVFSDKEERKVCSTSGGTENYNRIVFGDNENAAGYQQYAFSKILFYNTSVYTPPVDSTPPNITINYPFNGRGYKDASILLNATVMDAESGISNVTFNTTHGNTNVLLSAENSTKNWTATWNTVALTEGIYNISVFANDTLHNVKNNVNITIIIDRTAPNVSILFPLQNNAYNSTVTINASILDEFLGISNATFNITHGDTNMWLSASNTTGNWTASWNTALGVDGSYNVTVITNDSANNINNSVGVNVTVDNTKPQIELITPSNNSNITTFKNTLINFTWNATDNLATSPVCSLAIGNGSDYKVETTILSTNGTYQNPVATYYTSYFLLGRHNWTVNCTDNAFNINTSGMFFFNLNTPPKIELSSPANVSHVSSPTPTFVFNYSDADNEVGQCNISINGSNAGNFSNAVNTALVSITTALTLHNGTYWWNVNCTDGVDSNVSGNYTLVVDTALPAITVNYPKQDNTTWIKTNTFVINVTFNDTNLYKTLINITSNANGSSMYENITSDLAITFYEYNKTIDMATWADGKFLIDSSATDDVTGSPLQPNYEATKISSDDTQTRFVDKTSDVDVTRTFFIENKEGTKLTIEKGSTAPTTTDKASLVSADNFDGKHYESVFSVEVSKDLVNLTFGMTFHSNNDKQFTYRTPISKIPGHLVIGDKFFHTQDLADNGYTIITQQEGKDYTVKFYKKDSKGTSFVLDPLTGGLNNVTIMSAFYLDRVQPTTVLVYPNTSTDYTSGNINFSWYVNDSIDTTMSCNLTINMSGFEEVINVDSANNSVSNFSIPTSNFTTIGTYTWTVNCTDDASNVNVSNINTFTISSTGEEGGGGGGGGAENFVPRQQASVAIVTEETALDQLKTRLDLLLDKLKQNPQLKKIIDNFPTPEQIKAFVKDKIQNYQFWSVITIFAIVWILLLLLGIPDFWPVPILTAMVYLMMYYITVMV